MTKISNSIIWSPIVEHSAFSDDAYFATKMQGFEKQGFIVNLVDWLFKQGLYFDNVGTNLGTQHVDDWFTTYRSQVVTWLKDHVK